MEPVIVGKSLFKCYPGFAPVLRGVNISVEPGEMAAIMGPSGCGKSTMLHILGMLHAPDSGTLEILGTNVLDLDRQKTAAFRRENMGFVMQASNLFEHSTVFENVEFPLIYANVPPQERWERVLRALELVHLTSRVHYRSNRLSGGEQQRVAIARAMVNRPKILLADEPTGALDARTSQLIMENFRRLCHAGGVSMIMVTHDPKMADYCDSIYTLEEGVLHNRKHETPPLASGAIDNFLNPPEPLARGVLVANVFPAPADQPVNGLAGRLHALGLLSRIYALSRGGWLENPRGYTLPLPVRRIGMWQKIFSLRLFWRRARSSVSLWSLWRRMPRSDAGIWRKIKAFSRGAVLARWGLTDDIQFFYGSGAGLSATTAWSAAKLTRTPFAFSVMGRDTPHFGADWVVKSQDAVFVGCSTTALKNALLERLPHLEPKKIIVIRPILQNSPEDETEVQPLPGKILEVLTPGLQHSPQTYRTAIDAGAILKRLNIPFRLAVLGPKSFRQKLAARKIRENVIFLGEPEQGAFGETLKNADIFLASAPGFKGGELLLPQLLCQAMRAGLAIITAAISPGMADVLQADKNCLVAGDPAALSECLRKLSQDAILRARLGSQAQMDIRALLNPEPANKQITDLILAAVGAKDRLSAKGQSTPH